GTGKELIAGAIHYLSPRRNKPFIKVNCAAISPDLLESELFGHEKGSFTGAIRSSEGKFIMSEGGSILLDEVSEMSQKLQAKLLRVLQEREVDKVGGREPVKVDVRVMATTNRNLEQAIKEGRFREDLFYRINVVSIEFPPLRERKSDIPLLVRHFVDKYNREMNKRIQGISKDVEALLWKCDWPGNVRQLENVIERAVVLAKESLIDTEHLPAELHDQSPERLVQDGGPRVGMTVSEMERELIFKTLETVGDNRTKAAEMLGISIRTLRNKLNEYREDGFECPRKGGH
ncbi:MAG: sigma-54 dependent transcriptional regulator, partial [bacterium]